MSATGTKRSLIVCPDCGDITSSHSPFRNRFGNRICATCAEWDGENREINAEALGY